MPLVQKLHAALFLAAALLITRNVDAQQWEHIGPEGGLVVSLLSTPAGTVFLGTPDGHVFASEDAAAHWELRGRVGTRADGVVAQLISAKDGQILFAAIWYQDPAAGGGVFRSQDGGRTWQTCGLEGQAVRALEASPGNLGELLAGTRMGVFRSQDNGGTWQRISPADNEELQNIDSLAVDPSDSKIIYAGTYHLPWKTTDGGAHWEVAGTGMIDDSDVMSLRVDARNPSRLYLSACSGIYRSDNRAASWLKLQGIPYGSRRTQAIVQDPANPDTLFAATTQGLWLTRDGGENWKRTTPADWVINSLVLLPRVANSNPKVILGTEAHGIQVSEDGGETFISSNMGFRHVIGKQLSGDLQNPSHLLLLSEEGGLQLRESYDSGSTWRALPAIVSMRGKPKQLNLDTAAEIYGSAWGWFLRSTDGKSFLLQRGEGAWAEWKPRMQIAATGKAAGSKPKAPPYRSTLLLASSNALVASGESIFLATSGGVFRCAKSGECSPLSAFREIRSVDSLDVSSDGRQVFVTQAGKLGISLDGGHTAVWRDLPVGGGAILFVRAADSAASEVFLGTAKGLYRSTDGGSHWVLLQHGLPASRMEHWLQAGSALLVTTADGGMYASLDHAASWMRLNHDADRGGLSGLVELGNGRIAVGSPSEGVLAVSLSTKDSSLPVIKPDRVPDW